MSLLLICILTSCSLLRTTSTTTVTGRDKLSLGMDTPIRPQISEDFSSDLLVNLSTNAVQVQNNQTLKRKFSEGKQFSVGCQAWKGRPGVECSYSLVREDLRVKMEYDATVLKNGTLDNCMKTVLIGNELYELWKWVVNATYVGREKDKDGEVDVWHHLEGDTRSYLENRIGVSITDPDIPVFVRQTYRSGENSDLYVFRYSNFTTKVNEEFDIPDICKKI